MDKNQQRSKSEDKENNPPYKHCLNCGVELNDKYCHNCGQDAVMPNQVEVPATEEVAE